MIDIIVEEEARTIIVRPTGSLEKTDFEKLARKIDAFRGTKGPLVGLVIHTKSFPGWEDFGAFLNHMKFVKEHHKEIQRVAVVTDSKIGTIGPAVAKHFVSAKLKHFNFENVDDAKQWVKEIL